MATERVIGGLTGVERRAARRERLLAAALEIIGEADWAAATMTAICRRAGLTERYFYESFGCREELYGVLIESVGDEVRDRVLEALAEAGDDVPGRVRAVAEPTEHRQPPLARVADEHVDDRLGDERLARQRRRILGAFASLVRDQPRVFLGPTADLPPQVEIFAVGLVGGVDELVTRVLEGTLALADDELVDAITDFAVRLLE
jgi:AcrR family transcriptional regulator